MKNFCIVARRRGTVGKQTKNVNLMFLKCLPGFRVAPKIASTDMTNDRAMDTKLNYRSV